MLWLERILVRKYLLTYLTKNALLELHAQRNRMQKMNK